MSVVIRKFCARPQRTASQTWEALTNVIASSDQIKHEFLKVTGIAASVIADEVPSVHPFVVVHSGPRLRMYCLYGEDAISGEDGNESALQFTISSDWKAFIPCTTGDLPWISKTLASASNRFSAYDVAVGLPEDKDQPARASTLTIDVEGFKKL